MRKIKYSKDEQITAAALLFPSFVLLTLFSVIPLGYSFVTGFFDSSVKGVLSFNGIKTYTRILSDGAFWSSIGVGIRYAVFIVPIQVVLAFLLASLVKQLRGRISNIFRIVLYVPCVLSGVVVGVIFMSVFQYENGLFNALLSALYKPLELFGASAFEPVAWFAEEGLSWVVCSVAVIWAGLGYTTLIMLGGLYDIPADYYEAAEIDGAGVFARLFYITIPCLKNVLIYVLISIFVSAMQLFEIPYIMTGKGILNSTMGPIGYIYDRNYNNVKDLATVASLIVGLILALLSSVIFKLISSEKSEA